MFQIKTIIKLFPKSVAKRLPQAINIITIKVSESRRLNRLYRKKDRPTNVLSFFYNASYGEILLTPEVIRREARGQKNSYQYQYAWMVVHGLLHLSGVHHERSQAAARRVEKLEKKILEKLFGR